MIQYGGCTCSHNTFMSVLSILTLLYTGYYQVSLLYMEASDLYMTSAMYTDYRLLTLQYMECTDLHMTRISVLYTVYPFL